MSYKRITIPLSEDEQRLLRMAASRECRRPHDHVRYIVLSALGLTDNSVNEATKDNSDAIRQDNHVAVAGIAQ